MLVGLFTVLVGLFIALVGLFKALVGLFLVLVGLALQSRKFKKKKGVTGRGKKIWRGWASVLEQEHK